MKPNRIKKSNLRLDKYVKDLPSTIFADIQYTDYGRNIMERISRKEDNISGNMWAVNSRRDINYSSPVVFKPLNHDL